MNRFVRYLEEKGEAINRARERESMKRSGMTVAEVDASNAEFLKERDEWNERYDRGIAESRAHLARRPRWVRMVTWLPSFTYGPVISFVRWMEFRKPYGSGVTAREDKS